MIIIVLIGAFIFGWIFYAIHLIPLGLYGVLSGYIEVNEGYSTCNSCHKTGVALEIVDQKFSHIDTRIKKVLVSEEKDWVTCSYCEGAGVLHRSTSEPSPSHIGGERPVTRSFACEKCNGRGSWEEVVKQNWENKSYDVKMYDYKIHCQSCKNTFIKTQETRPNISTPKRTFLAIALREGLMKGMLSGLSAAFLWYSYWGIKKLIENDFDFGTLTDWITAIDAFLIAASIASLIGLVVGSLWGGVVSLIYPLLSRIMNPRSYLFSATTGASSLILLAVLLSYGFEDFTISSYNDQLSGYIVSFSLMALIGATTFSAGKFLMELVETRFSRVTFSRLLPRRLTRLWW